MRPPPLRRLPMRRVVVVVPSLFTLFNLFFGIWSIILASQGAFYRAGWFIVFAGILDLLDGLVARLSKTGTRFGAELDSLVDLVSFGVAPAFLVYQLEFSVAGPAAWVFCYFYVMAVAIRLARFNLTQAGQAKAHFVGLPSPAAGMTLATLYPFTQTSLYETRFAALPWSLMIPLLVIALTILMVSQVRYPMVPRMGVRTARGRLGIATNLSILIFGVWQHDAFFFPLGIAYMTYGVVRAAVLGLFEGAEADSGAVGGSIVIPDDDAVADAYGQRRRGVAPRSRESGTGSDEPGASGGAA